jgi:hypothetical protein
LTTSVAVDPLPLPLADASGFFFVQDTLVCRPFRSYFSIRLGKEPALASSRDHISLNAGPVCSTSDNVVRTAVAFGSLRYFFMFEISGLLLMLKFRIWFAHV